MATIYDVAKRAGVSPKTVSRVLNDDAPVNANTRKAVKTAMGELGYVPSRAARSMRSNKTGLIGLITGAITTNAESPETAGLPDLIIVQGIRATLAEAGFTLLIADTGEDPDNVPALMSTFAQHRVEGLFYVADRHSRIDLPRPPGEAELLLVNCFDEQGTPSVLPDDTAGQRGLVQRLIAAGHRRIGFLTLPDDLIAHGLRLAGYRAALEDAGIAYDGDLVIAAGLHHASPRETMLMGEAVDRMMALDDPPTVLCCGNDRMAMQLYGVLRTRGIAVPGDISVAGYDDHRLISETLYPPLTTAVLPYREMGERAAQWLIGRLRPETQAPDGPDITAPVRGPIVWRQSVIEHRNDQP
ncbi:MULTISPECIES: LacI family DNA-binding transcriptional regulator [unclassified Roseitalea]|uniref:LacI family DNA-binding transcriptional regulator n=1 Tax=unclassified Roseitalea TaxID=2639107 RepID=UPI00273F7838|nr:MULTISPECIES: LacI family DNA-binding transcriptional regulator [unclassified Roseitalea]